MTDRGFQLFITWKALGPCSQESALSTRDHLYGTFSVCSKTQYPRAKSWSLHTPLRLPNGEHCSVFKINCSEELHESLRVSLLQHIWRTGQQNEESTRTEVHTSVAHLHLDFDLPSWRCGSLYCGRVACTKLWDNFPVNCGHIGVYGPLITNQKLV